LLISRSMFGLNGIKLLNMQKGEVQKKKYKIYIYTYGVKSS